MDNRDFLVVKFVDNDVPNLHRVVIVGQEEQVSSDVCWFHAACEHHDDGTLTSRNDDEGLP